MASIHQEYYIKTANNFNSLYLSLEPPNCYDFITFTNDPLEKVQKNIIHELSQVSEISEKSCNSSAQPDFNHIDQCFEKISSDYVFVTSEYKHACQMKYEFNMLSGEVEGIEIVDNQPIHDHLKIGNKEIEIVEEMIQFVLDFDDNQEKELEYLTTAARNLELKQNEWIVNEAINLGALAEDFYKDETKKEKKERIKKMMKSLSKENMKNQKNPKSEVEKIKMITKTNAQTTEHTDTEKVSSFLTTSHTSYQFVLITCVTFAFLEKWATTDDIDVTNFDQILPKDKRVIEYPFELDEFQKRAVLRLENKENVFVAAHTSAGKTVVAEYAIALAIKHNGKAVYTSPIKALSNQKYRDFSKKFKDVGIMTGDVSLNSKGACMIMTTEILRDMLFKDSDIVRDLEWVIFDEIHYINDQDRGVVWEETIIMLPPQVGIVMLSATVENYKEFAEWVGRTKQKKFYVQYTQKRPVPLEHYIWFGSQKIMVKSTDGRFLKDKYSEFCNKISRSEEERIEKKAKLRESLKEKLNEFQKKGNQKERARKITGKLLKAKSSGAILKQAMAQMNKDNQLNPSMTNKEIHIFQSTIEKLKKDNSLPAIFFMFSKGKVQNIVDELQSVELTTRGEQSKIIRFFDDAMKKLNEIDREIPQFEMLKDTVTRGIGLHHGDLLPISKEIVEILLQDGLIKVLFATDSFAMGLNVPSKSVIFTGLKKFDGKSKRILNPGEYTQMSGRAGRRGLDDLGQVFSVVFDKRFLPKEKELDTLLNTKGDTLESKFKLTYQVIFSIISSQSIDINAIVGKSFKQNENYNRLMQLEKEAKDIVKKIKTKKNSLPAAPFYDNAGKEISILEFSLLSEEVRKGLDEINSCADFKKALNKPPYFCSCLTKSGVQVLCLLTEVYFKEKQGKHFKILHVVEKSNEQGVLLRLKSGYSIPLKSFNNYSYMIFDIEANELFSVFSEDTKLGPRAYEKDMINLLASKKLAFDQKKFVEKTFKLTQLQNYYQELEALKKAYAQNPWLNYEKRNEFKQATDEILSLESEKHKIDKDILNIKDALQINSYNNLIKVLKELGYVDQDNLPLLKARVARELGSIYLTEVFVNNIVENLEPEELASFFSIFIIGGHKNGNITEEDTFGNGDLPLNLLDAFEKSKQICYEVFEIEKKYEVVDENPEDLYYSTFHLQGRIAVYEWAKGASFKDILNYTTQLEGSVVRQLKSLYQLLAKVLRAFKLVGNNKLEEKITKAMTLIKRDVVFAVSLYIDTVELVQWLDQKIKLIYTINLLLFCQI